MGRSALRIADKDWIEPTLWRMTDLLVRILSAKPWPCWTL